MYLVILIYIEEKNVIHCRRKKCAVYIYVFGDAKSTQLIKTEELSIEELHTNFIYIYGLYVLKNNVNETSSSHSSPTFLQYIVI